MFLNQVKLDLCFPFVELVHIMVELKHVIDIRFIAFHDEKDYLQESSIPNDVVCVLAFKISRFYEKLDCFI